MEAAEHKAVKLFEFLREITKLKQTVCVNIENRSNVIYSESVPSSPYITTYSLNDEHILSIQKPTLVPPPQPPQSIADWLQAGWNDCDRELGHIDSKSDTVDIQEEEKTITEFFNQDATRVCEYCSYKRIRDEWARTQKPLGAVLELFTELYNARIALKREADLLEMLVADGFVTSSDNRINHPILTKKVSLTFDPENNRIYIDNTDNCPQIDRELISKALETLSKNKQDNKSEPYITDEVRELEEELIKEEYHPLDYPNVKSFLSRYAHSISDKCRFSDTPSDRGGTLPDRNELYIYSKPVFFIRKKPDGTGKAIQSIISTLNAGKKCPAHILDIIAPELSPASRENEECPLSESNEWSNVSGESLEILLAKPASEEQLRIAKEIMRNNAVLVQGPPGTGKTHTIANLLGHFLAQGKNVLVTSHTTKALEVLKDKLPEKVQALCATMIEDNNKDFAASVTKIAEKLHEDSATLQRECERIRCERKNIIDTLSEIRRDILRIRFSEWKTIGINGENLSPSELAWRVQQGRQKYEAIIPGTINSTYHSFPLDANELLELYRTNTSLNAHDEALLKHPLADLRLLPTPNEFQDCLSELSKAWESIQNCFQNAEANLSENCLFITIDSHIKFTLQVSDKESFFDIKEKIAEALLKVDGNWYKNAVIAGMKGSPFVDDWHILKQNTRAAYDFFCENKQAFDKVVLKSAHTDSMYSLQKVKKAYSGTLLAPFRRLFIGKHANAFSVNGKAPASFDDCCAVEKAYEMQQKRDSFRQSWMELMGSDTFSELNQDYPEFDAYNWLKYIDDALTWYDNFSDMLSLLSDMGIPIKTLLKIDKRTKWEEAIEVYLEKLPDLMSKLARLYQKTDEIIGHRKRMKEVTDYLETSESAQTELSQSLLLSYSQFDTEHYREHHTTLSYLHSKKTDKELRADLLKKLKKAAPSLSKKIENRAEGYNSSTAPENISDAWNWKIQEAILKELHKDSPEELSDKASDLSAKLRKYTEEQVEQQSWYFLLSKLNQRDDSKQVKSALKRLPQSIRKLGKGRNAANDRACVRADMALCQTAVPAWVMPISKALETLDAGEATFDIVIIDEASQANLSALVLAFMAKKLIIVGDDKQVSPLAIGVERDKVSHLVDKYLKNEIHGYNLYGAETSIYDLASRASFPGLMLKEHFRCVPDIIGYSNTYYYHSEIKPLRSSSSTTIKPSLVSYAVQGSRCGKSPNVTNETEAMAICALIRSCLEQEEYNGKTMGVISLLGEGQSKLIQDKISRYISPIDIEERNIICGIAAHFQGDERNVMFLSMVDALEHNKLEEPGDGISVSLRKVKNGNDIWKRYNVAVSRAKDQLWLIHSVSRDFLKPDDLRYELLQYMENPTADSVRQKQIEAKADSPFETEVAVALEKLHYKIEQQFEVGQYRIDIVVTSGNRRVAVECDGDRYHAYAGDEKIRQDMNRQLILERLGWQFIRIRGSQWYRNREQTLTWLCNRLKSHQIYPTTKEEQKTSLQDKSALQKRVMERAERYLDEWRQQERDKVTAGAERQHRPAMQDGLCIAGGAEDV